MVLASLSPYSPAVVSNREGSRIKVLHPWERDFQQYKLGKLVPDSSADYRVSNTNVPCWLAQGFQPDEWKRDLDFRWMTLVVAVSRSDPPARSIYRRQGWFLLVLVDSWLWLWVKPKNFYSLDMIFRSRRSGRFRGTSKHTVSAV